LVVACLALVAAAFGASPAFASSGEAPRIDLEYATRVHAGAAEINAAVDPNGLATTVHFEYGPEDCSAHPCSSTPDVSAGEGESTFGTFTEDPQATHAISGLSPATTYHYRAIATNSTGTTEGPDQTFKTFAPASGFRLPENRGYEMVSPLDKNGADISQYSSRTRVAEDGNAVLFSSKAAFGDVTGGGGSGGVDYIATRGPNGWSTHGISPSEFAEPLLPITTGLFIGDFTPNLDRGVYLALDSLGSEEPNAEVSERANLYLRTNALTAGSGSYSLLSGCPGCTEPLPPDGAFESLANSRLAYSDSTPDLGHVLFEDPANLTTEAIDANAGAGLSSSEPKLYEWDHGTVRLAGILPDNACGSPPCPAEASVAGSGPIAYGVAENAISEDGQRVIFTAAPFYPTGDATDTSTGLRGDAGNLYERVEHSSTIQINASERTDCAEANPCSGKPELDPAGHKPAVFMWATPEGTRVFFATDEQLTDSDHNHGSDLYMYDTTAPAGERLTLISENQVNGEAARAEEVLGGSEDGHYVYFAASEELLPGQSVHHGDRKVYVWHDGALRAIAGSARFVEWNDTATSYGSRVTPDGNSLVLTIIPGQGGKAGADELAGYDAEGKDCGGDGTLHLCAEVYVYNYAAARLQCASCPETNTAPQYREGDTLNIGGSDATLEFANVPEGFGQYQGRHRSQWITNDGHLVFFSTPEALVPEDTNGVMDAYEFDTQTGQAHLISSGESGQASGFVGATSDGHDVFFTARQKLVPGDKDSSVDLYDARVDGGFPYAGRAPACEGDACAGAVTVLNDPTPASFTFAGAGNLQAQKPLVHKHNAKAKRRHARKRRGRGLRRRGRRARRHTTRRHG
jgi:hypothetical protein